MMMMGTSGATMGPGVETTLEPFGPVASVLRQTVPLCSLLSLLASRLLLRRS